jgi:hypothetical protein
MRRRRSGVPAGRTLDHADLTVIAAPPHPSALDWSQTPLHGVFATTCPAHADSTWAIVVEKRHLPPKATTTALALSP